jgi:hypothetical protein
MLAVLDDRICGMLGLIPFDFNFHGTISRGSWLSHWICVPELRPYNVGPAMMWQVQKLKYDVWLAMGLSQAGERATAALGFKPISPIPRWVGVFDAEGSQQLLEALAPFADSRELARALLPYIVGRPSPARGQGSIRIAPWADSLSGSWDRFWARSLAPCLVGTARDSSYLLWRYVRHPRFRYQIFVAQAADTDEVLGLSVFRVENVQGHGARIMRIVEFLALKPADSALAAALVQAAREQDVTFADFFCTRVEMGAGLEAVGFRRLAEDDRALPLPRHLQPMQLVSSPLSAVELLSRDLRQRLGHLADRSDVYITKSDGDQDRPN